jgi:hypothetical protein
VVYKHWKRQIVLISYWNLQGIQEHPIKLPFTHHSLHRTWSNTFNVSEASDQVLWWLILLEEYEVTFEYLPGKKNVAAVADALSRIDIDILKIQEEEVLTLLSGSEKNSFSIIEFPMHTALIFKEQSKSRM